MTETLVPSFEDVLEDIQKAGELIERDAHIYADNEEGEYRTTLVSHVVMSLEYPVPTESMSGGGRTDIQVMGRANEPIFVAECSIWYGGHVLHSTDKQRGKIYKLTNKYLNSRDERGVVVIFSKRDSFSNVLDKVPEALREYPYQQGEVEERRRSWWRINCKDPSDDGMDYTVDVLLFDVST